MENWTFTLILEQKRLHTRTHPRNGVSTAGTTNTTKGVAKICNNKYRIGAVNVWPEVN